MPITDTSLTPARLWKRMTKAQRLAAARAFWSDQEAADDQLQAAVLIAQQKKFRPKTVAGFDADRKAQHLASLAGLPEALSARILVVYHLTDQRPMMRAFLDALGLQHEDGLIQDDVKPDEAKLAPAAAKLSEQFAAEDVDLYLNTLLCQDPETWGGLRGLPQLQAQPQA
jgi:hypothetical protein